LPDEAIQRLAYQAITYEIASSQIALLATPPKAGGAMTEAEYERNSQYKSKSISLVR